MLRITRREFFSLHVSSGVPMNRVGLFYHPDYLKHDTGEGHPERPERLRALMSHLLAAPEWHFLMHAQPRSASLDRIKLVHPESYIRSLELRCRGGERILDQGDTSVSPESYEIALLAAGGVVEGVDRVMNGDLQSVFCAVRPPGHHAGVRTAMGFCLMNNAAIGARHAQQAHGVERVAIVDWDVHHGNGTQEIFYDDASVLYVSVHQYPFYPGTGAEHERGNGAGEGITLNCPMKAGSGEKEYCAAFEKTILPALDRFGPGLLIISAGFDAHKDDPLAGIQLTEESFSKMTEMMMEASRRHCEGRIVSVLEGGYDVDALGRSVEAHLKQLLGEKA